MNTTGQYDEREYAAKQHQLAVGGNAIPVGRPADLPTLMNMLEEQVRRARCLSERANNLGDMVFGSRPECDTDCAPEPPATLESLVGKLTYALTDIDIALSRL